MWTFNILLAVAVTVAVVVCKNCDTSTLPDGTATKIFVGNHGGVIKVTNVRLIANNKTDYPVSLKHPIHVEITTQVSGADSYHNVTASASLAEWKSYFGDACKWHTIPTLGLLSNIPRYSKNGVSPGNSTMISTVDLSKFSTIVDLLADGATLQAKMKIVSNETATMGRLLSDITLEFTVAK